MAIETELKLSLEPAQLATLKQYLSLSKLISAPPLSRQLYSAYFDTPDLQLHQQRSALRLRRVGTQWIQTLKGGGGVQAGLHRRNEWEAPVAGEALDFKTLEISGGTLPLALFNQLQPVFVTDFIREMYLLNLAGAEIELCLDHGEIRAGDKKHIICEVELELKSGSPQQLFELALLLLDVVPLQIEHTNKAQYGYRLFSPSTPVIAKFEPPRIHRQQTLAEVLAAQVWSCLQHLQSNISGAIEWRDEEYLHQIRVALRRLRVVLALAQSFKTDAELSALTENVRNLCIDFGELRNWDVFITQTLTSVNDANLEKVCKAANQVRQQHHLRVQKTLQSTAFQQLLLRFGNWMYGDYWQAAIHQKNTLTAFAKTTLDKFKRQTEKRGTPLEIDNETRLHSLRIACKKLRYGLEMFGDIFSTSNREHYLKKLSRLQNR